MSTSTGPHPDPTADELPMELLKEDDATKARRYAIELHDLQHAVMEAITQIEENHRVGGDSDPQIHIYNKALDLAANIIRNHVNMDGFACSLARSKPEVTPPARYGWGETAVAAIKDLKQRFEDDV